MGAEENMMTRRSNSAVSPRLDGVDALIFLNRRARKPRKRRNYSPEETALLESLVGKVRPREIARRLKRSYMSMICQMHRLGYRYYEDLIAPLGGTVTMMAREIGIEPSQLWRYFREGQIRHEGREGGKDYFIPRAEIERFKKKLRAWQRKRERVLASIKVPTLSKVQVMKLLNVGETHIERYFQGGVIKTWKIPCKWSIDAPRSIWEWRASKPDAERVARERAGGKLVLKGRKYRAMIKRQGARITELRRARRQGHSGIEHTRACPVPGCLSPAQVAIQVTASGHPISEQQVYNAIWVGRLPAKQVQIGRRKFRAIQLADLPKYLAWFSRERIHTGPLHPHRSEIAKVHAAGLITVAEAAEIYHTTKSALRNAIQRGKLKVALRVGEVGGLHRQDVAIYRRNLCLKLRRRAAVAARGKKGNGFVR
jgi:transposase-like protein